MQLRAVVVWCLVAACNKADPTPPAVPSAERSEPNLAVERPLPVRTSQPKTARPALHPYSDANPPGVPHLDGELQTERGVQYIDEVVGTGAAPEKGKAVKVHYTGWLTDGSKFDSSRDRNEPISIKFDSGQVIKGWDIGLASMRVGGKRRLVIPSELGYGSHGGGEAIPPDSVMVFDVELVEAE